MGTPQLILLDHNGVEIERVAGVVQSKVEAILEKAGLT